MRNDIVRPLDYFEARVLAGPAPHLEYTYLDNVTFRFRIETIKSWILSNLKGRFYIGSAIVLNEEDNKLKEVVKLGFEDRSELSIFIIACPILKSQ